MTPPRHTTTVLRPFFRDHPGEPVPEENFWTLWCNGRLTEADTPTIQQGATPSGLTSAHLHHPPIFFTGRMPFLLPNQQRQSTEGMTRAQEIKWLPKTHKANQHTIIIVQLVFTYTTAPNISISYLWRLQCFDTVGWASEEHPVCKTFNDGVLVWLKSVCSEVQMICIWSTWCHCHPIISSSLKSRMVSPFWCQLTQVVFEKRQLNERLFTAPNTNSRAKFYGKYA